MVAPPACLLLLLLLLAWRYAVTVVVALSLLRLQAAEWVLVLPLCAVPAAQ
jgi:hypothetical protein